MTQRNCGYEKPSKTPPEPPVGTWVRDRHGATHEKARVLDA